MPRKKSKRAPVAFRGMMPILPTPLDANGKIDTKCLRRLVKYVMKCGAVAVGQLGGASEFFKISDPEREIIIKTVVSEVAGRVPVFIGVAGASERIAGCFAKQAQRLGADMLMAAPPTMERANAAELYEYYRAINAAVSIPIIIQDGGNAPALTSKFMCRLYNDMENIAYVKSEAGDFLPKTAELVALSRGKMPVIGGAGGKHMFHMLRLGVTSFMTGTECLDLHNAVVQAYLRGDEEEAARIYFEKLLPYLMFYYDHYRELLKQMLFRRGVIDTPTQLIPFETTPLSKAEQREFDWTLKRAGLFDLRYPDVGKF